MAGYRRSGRHRLVLVLVVLTSVTLLTLDERGGSGGVVDALKDQGRDLFAPVRSSARRVFAPVNAVVGGVLRYDDLKEENARLRADLEQARGDAMRAADAERERKELLELQGMSFAGGIPGVSARVVAGATSNFELTVDIDRGREAGVLEGMPAVTGAGLVGRVVEASRSSATVALLADQTSNVGVRLVTSGDIGVTAGRGLRQPLALDLVEPGTVVPSGEIVVTSGLQQSVYPPGIPVGRVRSASVRPGALQQDVRVDPVVDLRRLTFVKVLKWSPAR